jgi:hypothetical protein
MWERLGGWDDFAGAMFGILVITLDVLIIHGLTVHPDVERPSMSLGGAPPTGSVPPPMR